MEQKTSSAPDDVPGKFCIQISFSWDDNKNNLGSARRVFLIETEKCLSSSVQCAVLLCGTCLHVHLLLSKNALCILSGFIGFRVQPSRGPTINIHSTNTQWYGLRMWMANIVSCEIVTGIIRICAHGHTWLFFLLQHSWPASLQWQFL